MNECPLRKGGIGFVNVVFWGDRRNWQCDGHISGSRPLADIEGTIEAGVMKVDRREEHWWVYRSQRHREVRTIASSDGRVVIAICQRSDGLFCFYVDELEYVTEREEDFWQPGSLETGVFGSMDEAEREARSRYRELDGGHV